MATIANYEDPAWYKPQEGDARRSLTAGQKNALQSCLTELCSDMSPRDTMDRMISDLAMRMNEIPYDGRPKKDVRRAIVEKVLTGNLKCLKSFMRALEHDDGGTPHLAEQLNQAFKLHCAGEFDGPPAYVAPGGDVQPSPSTTHTNNPVQAADALAIQSTGGHCSLQPLHSACKSLRREAGDSQVITTKPIAASVDDLSEDVVEP